MSDKNDSTRRISIIALIFSIIALLINLFIFFSLRDLLFGQKGEPEQPAVEQVQPAQPAAPQAEEAEEPAPIVVADEPVKKKAPTAAFIDLGLPSGTKWRSLNEDELLTFDDAVAKYGKQLPSQKQFTELYEKCTWQELKNGGYKATGPNGNSVIFPLTGYINCTGEFRGDKEMGDYWTSTPKKDTDEAYRVAMMKDKGVKIVLHTRCYQRAIRLVEK